MKCLLIQEKKYFIPSKVPIKKFTPFYVAHNCHYENIQYHSGTVSVEFVPDWISLFEKVGEKEAAGLHGRWWIRFYVWWYGEDDPEQTEPIKNLEIDIAKSENTIKELDKKIAKQQGSEKDSSSKLALHEAEQTKIDNLLAFLVQESFAISSLGRLFKELELDITCAEILGTTVTNTTI